MNRFFKAALTLLTVAATFSPAGAQNIQNSPIDRFHEVSPGVYRGARPSEDGLRFLADIGVKTILYLDNSPDNMQWETDQAAKLGIKVIQTPMSGFWSPKDKQVNKSLQALNDGQNKPIFVHCQHGRDRTGLIVGLHRVEHEGWDPADAYQEMLDRGFRTALVGLDDYFRRRTGYKKESESVPIGFEGN